MHQGDEAFDLFIIFQGICHVFIKKQKPMRAKDIAKIIKKKLLKKTKAKMKKMVEERMKNMKNLFAPSKTISKKPGFGLLSAL